MKFATRGKKTILPVGGGVRENSLRLAIHLKKKSHNAKGRYNLGERRAATLKCEVLETCGNAVYETQVRRQPQKERGRDVGRT